MDLSLLTPITHLRFNCISIWLDWIPWHAKNHHYQCKKSSLSIKSIIIIDLKLHVYDWYFFHFIALKTNILTVSVFGIPWYFSDKIGPRKFPVHIYETTDEIHACEFYTFCQRCFPITQDRWQDDMRNDFVDDRSSRQWEIWRESLVVPTGVIYTHISYQRILSQHLCLVILVLTSLSFVTQHTVMLSVIL